MRSRREGGGTLLEAAIVLPLLFMFLFGIIEFGRVFNMYQTMTNAAREGARFGVAPCQSGDPTQEACTYEGQTFWPGYMPSNTTVTQYVNHYLDAANMRTGSTVVVDDVCTPYNVNVDGESYFQEYRYVTVTITADYDWLFFPFPNLPLHTQSVMKDELSLPCAG